MMHMHKCTLHFRQIPVRYRINSRIEYTKKRNFFSFLLLFFVSLVIFELTLWSMLPWKVVPEEKMVGRKKMIQKDDEDILVHAAISLTFSEFSKPGIAWVTRVNANEIYTISTNAFVNFDTVVERVVALLNAEARLIDIRLATEREMPLLSLFTGNRKYEFFNHPDEVRERIAQSSRCEVKVLTSAGFMEMNPVLVKVQLQRHSKDQTQLEIQGISKEGWIRQHAGEKAVRSIAQRIEGQLGV